MASISKHQIVDTKLIFQPNQPVLLKFTTSKGNTFTTNNPKTILKAGVGSIIELNTLNNGSMITYKIRYPVSVNFSELINCNIGNSRTYVDIPTLVHRPMNLPKNCTWNEVCRRSHLEGWFDLVTGTLSQTKIDKILSYARNPPDKLYASFYMTTSVKPQLSLMLFHWIQASSCIFKTIGEIYE